MRNVVGICNLHDGPHLGGLTKDRPLGAVTFLGRYGLMDFALSDFSNSGIDRIAILAENNVQAVRTHMGSGSIWVNNTITGFIRYFSNEKMMNNAHFNTDLNNIRANAHQIEGLDCEYVVVMSPFFLMSIDLKEVLDAHIASGADITVVYKNAKKANVDYANCDEIFVKEDGTIEKIYPFNNEKKNADISLEIFVYNRSAFERIVRESKQISELYNLRQMVSFACNHNLLKVNAYKFDGYVAPILSLELYNKYSFELLDYSVRRKLFQEDWPIYTTTHNTPPTIYGPKADVKNSFIANGSIINGKVHNSIVSRNVVVEEDAVVEDSILFTDAKVGAGVKVSHVLADKSARLEEKKRVAGDEENILYIDIGAKI